MLRTTDDENSDDDDGFIGGVDGTDDCVDDAAMRGDTSLLRVFPLQQDSAHVAAGRMQRHLRDETNHAQVCRTGKRKYASIYDSLSLSLSLCRYTNTPFRTYSKSQ